jgi:chromosome segregation ATPase
MEEYLQYMKTLRSQMNDVEDQAAKISVEEQMQLTSIQTMEKDLDSAKSETKKLKEDTDQMMKAKGLICSQILEKQRKIASLESDSSTLTQVRPLPMCIHVCSSLFCTKYQETYTRE